jgi:hypothetical protein
LFAELQHVKYGQITDSSWNNTTVGANVILKKDSSIIEFNGEASYVISGFDQKNYLVTANASTPEYKFGQLKAKLNIANSSPDLNYRLFESNNFIWRSNLLKIHSADLVIQYSLPQYQFSLAIKNSSINNYVFLDLFALPHQYTGVMNIKQVEARKNFTWRRLHFDNIITYQSTGRTNILHIPDFVTDQSLYIEKRYFNNALLMASGFALNYNSSYYADAFMPATAMFYLQNEKKTGGYARVDLFINAKIKTARIFIRMENLFDGLVARSYYLTPHYPMPGRVLRFGLSWRFYDQ